MAANLAVEQAIQFFFNEQWCALQSYCAERKIRILGDVAIFVSYDSADVWTHPEIFELDDQRKPIRVSGVPPDYFSATGQRWGNPLYKWGVLRERGFDWWVARIRRALAALRHRSASITSAASKPTGRSPPKRRPPINGQWVKAPGHELFQRLKEVFGDLPFIAEDLGLITPEVDELREHFGMPGMRILQFGFSDRGATSICRIASCPTPSSTPAPTTTTPPSAGGAKTQPRRERNKRADLSPDRSSTTATSSGR